MMENLKPNLRFHEFKDEWKKEVLNNIVDVRDGTHDSPKYISESKYFLLTSKNLNKDGRLDFNDIKYLNKTDFDKINLRSKVEYNDILFGMIGTIGNPVLIKENEINFAIKNMALLKKSENILPDFLLQQFKSPIIDKQFNKLNTGNTQKFISLSTIRNLLIFNPTKPEQTKIADFLGAVDKQLELLTTKKEKLQLYKKGVMQKLFSQEIRFTKEDGTNYPDWEEKTFGELYEFNPTNSFSRDKLNYDDGEIMNIHYGDIHTNFKSQFNIDNEIVPFINRDVKINSNHKFVDNGDIIIADASENLEDIGKAIEVLNIGNKKILSGLHTLHAKPQNSNLYFGFMSYLLKSKDFRKQVQFIAQGTKVLSITGTRIAKIKFNLPSIEEQTKIADFLIAIDNQIDAIDNQITKTENYKKGLLQQMFV